MVLDKVVGIDVMPSVSGLPREIWGHQSRVCDPSNSVVQVVVLGESTVSTFVTNDLRSHSVTMGSKHGAISHTQIPVICCPWK